MTDILDRSPPSDEMVLDETYSQNWINQEPRSIYDLVVIGGGPAGLTAATTARSFGAKVALIEENLLGGECINYGCISSKALIRTSRAYADMRRAALYGAEVPSLSPVDFKLVRERMHTIRAQIRRHLSADHIQKQGIDLFRGSAAFSDTQTIRFADKKLSFKKAIVATGARPRIPDIPGLREAGYHTNYSIFDLDRCPESMVVIGGGAEGCELAQAFCRLGSQVTIVQCDPMFLDNIERDGAQILSDAMAQDGVAIRLNTDVVKIERDGSYKIIHLVCDDIQTTIKVKDILIGVGQIPNTQKLNLKAAHITLSPQGGIEVDAYARTSNRKIFAVGNVCAGHKLSHIPDSAARLAARNAVLGKRQKLHKPFIPWCIYTDPEIAHVGIQVKEARQRGIPVKTFTVLMHEVDRAIADSEEGGFVKIHVLEGCDKILGATLVSRHAGDMMNSISLALKAGLGLGALATVDYPYPTQSDAIKKAAAAYVRSKPPSFLGRLFSRWCQF